jgi:hypothetical protein
MARFLLGAEPEKEERGGQPESGQPVAAGQPVAGGQQKRGTQAPRFQKHLPWHTQQPKEEKRPEARADVLSSLKQYANIPQSAYQVWKATEGKEYERVSPLEAGARGFATGFTETATSIPIVSMFTGPLLRLGALPEPPVGSVPQVAKATTVPTAIEAAPTLEEKRKAMEASAPPPQLAAYKTMETAGQIAGAAFGQWLAQKALSQVAAPRETRVYAPEKVEVTTAQRGDTAGAVWKLGEPTKDITEKWVMGSPAPRITSPEAPYYEVPVGLKEHGATLKVGKLPFSLHPSALELGGGGTEAVATLTREGGSVVVKGLPEASLPYAGKQTLSVIFPWEGAAEGTGKAALSTLPPPSGGAAAAVPTGGGGLLSLEKLSPALGGGGVPGVTLKTVARATPLPVVLPVLPSSAQTQKKEAGSETVVRKPEDTVPIPEGSGTVVIRSEDTVPRRSEDTVPMPEKTGDTTVVRKPEDTVPIPESETGGTTVAIPMEKFPTIPRKLGRPVGR